MTPIWLNGENAAAEIQAKNEIGISRTCSLLVQNTDQGSERMAAMF